MGSAADTSPPPLDSLPMSASLRRLAARGNAVRYDKGRVLIREGQEGGTLFIIVSGQLRVFSVSDDGSKTVAYGEYLPGQFVGEMSLDGSRRAATVQASVASWCVLITRHTLLEHIRQEPEFSLELLYKASQGARAATDALRTVAFNDVHGRVVRLLDTMATSTAGGGRAVGPMSQQDMADKLACDRSMVSRVLRALQDGGHIQVHRHRIELLTPLPAHF